MICTAHQILSGDEIEKNEVGGASSTYGGERRCIQDLARKPEGMISLGRPRHRWEDNIEMDLFRKWDVGNVE